MRRSEAMGLARKSIGGSSMKIKCLIIAAAAVGLVLSGCAPAPPPDTGDVSHTGGTPTGVQVPRPFIDEEFVSRIDGSTATIPLMRATLQLLRGTDAGMKFNKTIEAYDNLIAGDKDVIFVTPPSKEELAAAAEAGVELEVIPIVKDALVFMANTANRADGLTSQQVKDIYTGKTTNWKQVGGADLSIIPYQRQVNSGSQTLFLQLAMGGTKPMKAPEGYFIDTMEGLVDHIAVFDNSEQALGYSVFYFTQEMYVQDSTKLLAIDGVAPSSETIADGSYAYLSNYFAVMRKSEPSESVARQLVEWCLTDEAQQLFSATRYVPLEPRNIVPPVSGYGYQGSTPENTTQSSGTGGPVGWKVPVKYYENPCLDIDCVLIDDDGNLISSKTPNNPQVEASINAWLSEITQGTMRWDLASLSNADAALGLLEVYISDHKKDESAMFRLSDGHRMELSDFFYDGVNYIDFINRTLLNDAANMLLRDSDFERTGPFTGLSAHTRDFEILAENFCLRFFLRAGNPFVAYPVDDTGARDADVDLMLPHDLSPYGYLWQTKQVMVNGHPAEHVVGNYQGVNPQDAKINATIDAWVAKQKGKGVALVDVFSESMDHYGGEPDSHVLVFKVSWELENGKETSAIFGWNTCKKIA